MNKLMFILFFILGGFVSNVYNKFFNKEQCPVLSANTQTKETKTEQNKESIIDTVKHEQKEKIVYRTITKYYPQGSIKEVIHESSNESKKGNQVTDIVNHEKSRIETQEKNTVYYRPIDRSWGIGAFIPANNLLDLGSNKFFSNKMNSSILLERSILPFFDIAISADFKGFEFQSVKLGGVYKW